LDAAGMAGGCHVHRREWQGYRISPGTLYPILYSLEKKGHLRSRERREGKSLRKIYCATSKGRRALEASKDKIRELFHEVVERH
jgi:DNA-binding PadR family transcriptional regulator